MRVRSVTKNLKEVPIESLTKTRFCAGKTIVIVPEIVSALGAGIVGTVAGWL
jgi:hypothetical protein